MNELLGGLWTTACAVVFLATFFMGEIVGYAIERNSKNRWRAAAEQVGMAFVGRRRKMPSLSNILLPKLLLPGLRDSIFCYGESIKYMKGRVRDCCVPVTDFAVWNYHTRGPLVFRGVLCVIRSPERVLRGQVCAVKFNSPLFDGFRYNESFRAYTFPNESDFSRSFAVFGQHSFAPWTVTPDVRTFLADNKREIDFMFADEREVVILWADRRPERLQSLVEVALGAVRRLKGELEPTPEQEEDLRGANLLPESHAHQWQKELT